MRKFLPRSLMSLKAAMVSSFVCALFLVMMMIGGCSNSSTHGTEKELDVNVTINNNGNGDVKITSPLTLDSASETAQDTANKATTSPTTRLQLTEGGSTAAGEGSELKDVASTLKNKLNSENKEDNHSQTNPAVTQAKPTTQTTTTSQEEEIEGTTGPAKSILWKPVAKSGGMLVVLLPATMGHPAVSVTDMAGVTIETGDYVGDTNPNRATYRFDRPGAKFPAPCLLRVGDAAYKVDDPAKRNESLPLYVSTL